MGEAMDLTKVTEVLLANGNWMPVVAGSLHLNTYEFERDGEVVHRSGENGVCPTGFRFKSGGGMVFGPIDAIVAMKTPARGE